LARDNRLRKKGIMRKPLLFVPAALLLGSCAHVPLYTAITKGDVAAVDRFLAQGYDVDKRAPLTSITPLMLAAAAGDLKISRLLLDRGANPNVEDKDGSTALFYALGPTFGAGRSGACEIAGLLIAKGAETKIRNKQGRTATNYGRLAVFLWVAVTPGGAGHWSTSSSRMAKVTGAY
jgi:ankyrin repeat protein